MPDLPTSTPSAGTRSPPSSRGRRSCKGSFDQYAESQQGQARHRRGGRCLPGGDRALAGPAGAQHRPAQPGAQPARAELRRADDHRPASSSCASARTAASSSTGSCRRCSTAARSTRACASSSARPTSATTPGCSTSRRRRGRPKPPDGLTPGAGDRRQAAQGYPRRTCITPKARTSSRCCRRTSWGRCTSSSWAR